MSASNPSGGRVAAENELLARLGLPPSASPEDVDRLHLAVSHFLAAAPQGISGWAHAQAAMLDEAYLSLTDPVGLEGSALRSPTRPPTVVPGGPATPPARRDPVPAVAVATAKRDAAGGSTPVASGDDTDTDDLDALFASVTPGAHRDMVSGGRPERTAAAAPKARKAAAPVAALATPDTSPAGRWKAVALGLLGVVIVAAVLFVGYNLGGGGAVGVAAAGASPSPSVQTVDMAQVASLMTKLQANPNDTATLQAVGDTYFSGGDYATAGTFYDKVLAIDGKNEQALLARGAVYFNSGDPINAQKLWQQVIALDPKSQEAHYDLGFLYMSQASPDWAKVQTEWKTVISIDSKSALAQNVQKHLDSLAQSSLIPAASGSAGASGSAAPSGAASPAASGSTAPSGSPAAPSASTTP